jgi:hypothetical protein
MSEQNTAVATVPKENKAPVAIGFRGLEVKTLDDLWRVSNYISKSGLAPKGIETPEAIFTALELGLELGLPPMAALQNIAVINGRPGVFGDVQLALVRASGLLEEYSETEIGNPKDDTWGVQCVCKRVGSKFANSTFTVADAKKAQLWGKSGPWTQYPKRMLKFRARGYLLRDEFGDVLKGIKTVEELKDLEGDGEEQRFRRAKPANGFAAPPPPVEAEAQQISAPPPPIAGPTTPPQAARSGTDPAPVAHSRRGASPDDEKAEADAGLAPATDGGPGLSESQEALLAILTSNGFTFEDLKRAGAEMVGDGNLQSGVLAWDTYAGIEEFPEKASKFFFKAQAGMLDVLRATRKGAV